MPLLFVKISKAGTRLVRPRRQCRRFKIPFGVSGGPYTRTCETLGHHPRLPVDLRAEESRPPKLMKIIVCPLAKVGQIVAAHAPERVVSLLDPDFDFPQLGSAYGDRHLRLHFHDVHECAPGQVCPAPKHVDQLLVFLGRWHQTSPLLIHCRAGIGRSTAAAFIAACVHNPNVDERTIALSLRRASSLARPNQVLIELADAAMERNGRMTSAIEETGRNLQWHGIDENFPFEIPGTFPLEQP